MKVVTVCGIQGSGKTTFIRWMIARFRSMGNQSAVIVNERGKEDFDADFARTHQLRIERLRGG